MDETGKLLPLSLATQATVSHVQFSTLMQGEIERLSVVEVTESTIYKGGEPVQGGVNDPRMGIVKAGQRCKTCLEDYDCQGHFGHVKLAEPIFNVGYVKYIDRVLRCLCHNCGKLKDVSTEEQHLKMKQIAKIPQPTKRLRELAAILGQIGICNMVEEDGKIVGCNKTIPTKVMVKEKMRIFVEDKGRKKKDREIQYFAKDVKNIMEKIDPKTRRLLGFTASNPVDLVISTLVIAPPQIRTSVELGPEKMAEDDITHAYRRIVSLNNQTKKGIDGFKKINNTKQIQTIVASIMVKLDKKYMPPSNDKNSKKKIASKIKSIEERLTSKEGRFRQNLMGKRVNFSARTVISPDSQLDLDEIGVPEKIAAKMTVPEVIHQFNFQKIVRLCKEGKIRFLLQPQIGKKTPNFIYLNNLSKEEIPKYLTYGTIAERQLENGDYVLFNRQPTLHRMSMMGHRVRILPYDTFRLNLSVCSPYNADFDGDEMNMHVPQSVEAMTQLKHLASVSKQVISPKNGAPVMGVVQDTLLGTYLISDRDSFFTKAEVLDMLAWIDGFEDRYSVEFPIPCILKPQPLWSGKQLLSFFLPKSLNISYLSTESSKINLDDRTGLLIKQGQLITGSLIRDQVGPGSGKIIHSIWVEMGPDSTRNFIMNLQKLVENYLMYKGFSVGLSDILINRQLERLREEELEKIKEDYYKNIHMFRNLPQFINQNIHQKGKKVADSLEYKINLDLNNSLSRIQKIVAQKVSVHHNNIYKMIAPRSKGSETNLAQIVCCLGNQNVDGKRCPQGFEGRALPHFNKEDNSPEPRGFVFSSFFKGLKPHEFFFHSMAGRQGLSDTAVKTSSIGYLQRKLIKALEDLSIRYDGTVRDCQDTMYQRCYGQDGFLPEYIQLHKFNEAKMGENAFVEKFSWTNEFIEEQGYSQQQKDLFSSETKHLLEMRKLLRDMHEGTFGADDMTYHCPINVNRILKGGLRPKTEFETIVDPARAIKIVNVLIAACQLPRIQSLKAVRKEKEKELGENMPKKKEDTSDETEMQILHGHLRVWLCSTRICNEFQLNQEKLIEIVNVVRERFLQAIAPAGEPVGALAAQSIGEPTTQMTLNTFHLAGVSDKNVTLGIPRLRQLLDISKNIKTPLMTVYYHKTMLWENIKGEEAIKAQRKMLSELPVRTIKDVLLGTKIYYDAGEEQSNIDGSVIAITERARAKKTPWVLILKFDFEKVIGGEMYDKVMKCLKDKFSKEFDIDNKKGVLPNVDPEIEMRLTTEASAKLGHRNVFKFVKTKQIDVKNIVISGIKGIKSVKTARKIIYKYKIQDEINMSLENRLDEMVFDVVGSNLNECLRNPYIDSRKTVSNDLSEVEAVLGIEAAKQCLINEIKEVLKPYSIYVNHRHLAVLADWMAARGRLIPVNRFGINRVKDISIFRKASFEETMDVLYSAAAFSEVDPLKGVSERIIFGEKLRLGTNSCEIHVDKDQVGNFVYQPLTNPQIYEKQNTSLGSAENTPTKVPREYLLSPNRSVRIDGSNISRESIRYSKSPSYVGGSSPTFSAMEASEMSHEKQENRISPLYQMSDPSKKQEQPSPYIASRSPVYQSSVNQEQPYMANRSPVYSSNQEQPYVASSSPSYHNTENQAASPVRPSEEISLSDNDEEDDVE